MPLFSIVIPTYNRATFIVKAIDSVLSQTFVQWELIVVDDASTDDTANILNAYTDARIKIIRHDSNQERSVSRNRGIAEAIGEYICFLDSDDYFLPNHLQVLATAIETHKHPQALFHTGVEQVNWQTKSQRLIEREVQSNAVEDVLALPIPVISVAVHHFILKSYQFDTRLRINEDVYLFAQIAATFPVIYLPETTVIWVLHGNNTQDSEKDYLTPQLMATQRIFADASIAPFVSSAFRKNKYQDLYTELIYFEAVHHRPLLALKYAWKSFCLLPFHKQNKTNILNVLYHLPGGGQLKKAIKVFRS